MSHKVHMALSGQCKTKFEEMTLCRGKNFKFIEGTRKYLPRYLRVTSNWQEVTCGKCLNKRDFKTSFRSDVPSPSRLEH